MIEFSHDVLKLVTYIGTAFEIKGIIQGILSSKSLLNQIYIQRVANLADGHISIKAKCYVAQ